MANENNNKPKIPLSKKQAVEEGMKLLKNKKMMKKIILSTILPALLPILLIIVIASSVFSIFAGIGNAIEGVWNKIVGFFNPEQNNYDLSEEELEKMISAIEDTGIKFEDLGILDRTG